MAKLAKTYLHTTLQTQAYFPTWKQSLVELHIKWNVTEPKLAKKWKYL